MNRKELVSALAAKNGSTKVAADKFLDDFQEVIMTAVANGSAVKLTGFGCWEAVERAAKVGRNPITGETIQIPSKVVPRFKPGKEFKDMVAAAQ